MTHLVHVNPLLFEPGERLSLEAFLDQWERMPGLKFAELIDGVVYLPSPLSLEHGRRDGKLQTLLGVYAIETGVCEIISNATWLMVGNAPQPDVVLRVLPEFGGLTRLSGKLGAGTPELIVEVCGSSRSFDLGPKLALYQTAGVQEYVTLLLEEQRVEWRQLLEGSYRLKSAEPEGVYKSDAFPGLWLDEPALWEANGRRLADRLREGLQSVECKSFLERLHQRAG